MSCEPVVGRYARYRSGEEGTILWFDDKWILVQQTDNSWAPRLWERVNLSWVEPPAITRIPRDDFNTFMSNFYVYVQAVQDIDPFYKRHFNVAEMRLGRAFLEKYFPDVQHPELFYETDQHKAIDIITETYVDAE